MDSKLLLFLDTGLGCDSMKHMSTLIMLSCSSLNIITLRSNKITTDGVEYLKNAILEGYNNVRTLGLESIFYYI